VTIRPQGRPDKVNIHDFADNDLGKAVPYGVYDIGANAGWVGASGVAPEAQPQCAARRPLVASPKQLRTLDEILEVARLPSRARHESSARSRTP
jgi:hypothetical protein